MIYSCVAIGAKNEQVKVITDLRFTAMTQSQQLACIVYNDAYIIKKVQHFISDRYPTQNSTRFIIECLIRTPTVYSRTSNNVNFATIVLDPPEFLNKRFSNVTQMPQF